MKRPVVFLYPVRDRYLGSTVMRGEQLSASYRDLPGMNREVRFAPIELANPRDSVVIMTKAAMQRVSSRRLEVIKKRRNRLVFDLVDSRPSKIVEHYADVVLAASRSAVSVIREEFPSVPIHLVDHHVDPRVENMVPKVRPEMNIGYFGEIFNTIRTTRIEDRVDFIPVSTRWQRSGWLERLPNYAAHYAVRRLQSFDWVKPFTKGFTAAHCGANIVIQANDPEALHWLGGDYPYLIHGDVSERSILEVLERLVQSFGSAEFQEALGRMSALRAASTGQAVARQLDLLVESLD